MCTALTYCNGDHYFGRNLDLEYGYQEKVVVFPRNAPFRLRNGYLLPHHYAMIGMATVSGGYPLYYEATNERGLSMAGLNFPKSCQYHSKTAGLDNIAPFELIPWILSQCATLAEAKRLLDRTNLWNLPFSREYPVTPLHWFLADKNGACAVESTQQGLQVYEDPVGVLTNEPPFPYHMTRLADYMQLSPQHPQQGLWGLPVTPYSFGMGAMGLPGDYSSVSRFVRAAFVRCHSRSDGTEEGNVSQFFHILGSVAMPKGSVALPGGGSEITLCSCCCNTDRGIYYYTTYENSRIHAVQLRNAGLDAESVIEYPLVKSCQITRQN